MEELVMIIYLLIPLLCCIIALIILISTNGKKNVKIKELENETRKLENLGKEEIRKYFEEEWIQQEQEFKNRIEAKEKEEQRQFATIESNFSIKRTELQNQLDGLNELLKEKEKRYVEVNQDLDLYRQGKIKEIDGTAAEYEERKRILVSQSVDKYRDQLIEQANDIVGNLTLQIDDTKSELEKIQTQLEEERRKRAAVNEEILRQRALEEKQDFYRIQLKEEDREDVEILRSMAPRLRHPEVINKVIWSGYYQKPLAELRKRVAIEGSGVYKITRMKTGEIYIGQAVNISTRWSDHCKSALGVGTLASSQLHRVMAEDGCENFLFEVLEEVPRDKLRERESYYIDFYDSKTYGLNTLKGDKQSGN